MIDALRAFICHLRSCCRAQVSTAAGLEGCLFAGPMVFWLIMFVPPYPLPATDLKIALASGFAFAMCGEILLRAVQGTTMPWGATLIDLPVPALPVGRRARAAAEALATLTWPTMLLVAMKVVVHRPFFAGGTPGAMVVPRLAVFGAFVWASACVPRRTRGGQLLGVSIVCIGLASAANVGGLGWKTGPRMAPESIGATLLAFAVIGVGVLPRWERIGLAPRLWPCAPVPGGMAVPFRRWRSVTSALRRDLMRSAVRCAALPGGAALAILALLVAGDMGAGSMLTGIGSVTNAIATFFPLFVLGSLLQNPAPISPADRVSHIAEILPVGQHTIARYVLMHSTVMVLAATAMACAIRSVALFVGNVELAKTSAGWVGSFLTLGPAPVAWRLERDFGRQWYVWLLSIIMFFVGIATFTSAFSDPGLPSVPFFSTPFVISTVAVACAVRHTAPAVGRWGRT